MTYEYATTFGAQTLWGKGLSPGVYEIARPPDNPRAPEGEGWEMCGAAASFGGLYWFWRRAVKGEA